MEPTQNIDLQCKSPGVEDTSCMPNASSGREDENVSENHSKVLTLLQMRKKIYDGIIIGLENNEEFEAASKYKKKISVMQSYLEQVEEHNNILVAALGELEREARERVKQMENRLKSSAKTVMEAMISIHQCEKEMQRLVEDRLSVQSLVDCMGQLLTSLKNENNYLRDQNYNLNHDLQALLQIIHHARSTGHWEMNCISLCEVSPEQIFGPIQSISNIASDQMPSPENIQVANEV